MSHTEIPGPATLVENPALPPWGRIALVVLPFPLAPRGKRRQGTGRIVV